MTALLTTSASGASEATSEGTAASASESMASADVQSAVACHKKCHPKYRSDPHSLLTRSLYQFPLSFPLLCRAPFCSLLPRCSLTPLCYSTPLLLAQKRRRVEEHIVFCRSVHSFVAGCLSNCLNSSVGNQDEVAILAQNFSELR